MKPERVPGSNAQSVELLPGSCGIIPHGSRDKGLRTRIPPPERRSCHRQETQTEGIGNAERGRLFGQAAPENHRGNYRVANAMIKRDENLRARSDPTGGNRTGCV